MNIPAQGNTGGGLLILSHPPFGPIQMSSTPSNLRGALLALAAFGLYATHDSVVKYIGHYYSPVQVLFFGVLMSFPVVTMIMLRDKTDGTLIPRYPGWTIARTIAVVITGLCAFYAFSHLPLAQCYAIFFSTPLIITVLAIPILGEKVRLRRGLAVFVGLIGVLIVLRPGTEELRLGHAAALIAAFTGAFASVVVRKVGQEERSAVLMLYPMVANFIVMGIALPFVYKPMPVEHLGGFMMMAVLGNAGSFAIIAAYRRAEAMIVAPMQFSQIVWATLYGYVLFGERVDRATFIGAAVVIASGLYILFREGRADVSETRPVLQTRGRAETGTMPRGSLIQRLRDGVLPVEPRPGK